MNLYYEAAARKAVFYRKALRLARKARETDKSLRTNLLLLAARTCLAQTKASLLTAEPDQDPMPIQFWEA
jgi:hypothetical protein